MLLVSTSNSRKTAPAPRTYHHGELRDALLEAGAELITKAGWAAFTLREAARRAGVSHNAPYRHFRDKDELLAAVAAQGFERLTASMQRAASRGKTAAERWQLSGHGYIAFALRHPNYFLVMFDSTPEVSGHPACQAAGQGAFETLLGFVAEAQAEGAVMGGDPMPVALTSWATVHGLAKLAIAERMPVRGDQVLRFFDEFVAGVLQRGLCPPAQGAVQREPTSRGKSLPRQSA